MDVIQTGFFAQNDARKPGPDFLGIKPQELHKYTGHTETVNEISKPVTLLILAVMYFFCICSLCDDVVQLMRTHPLAG